MSVLRLFAAAALLALAALPASAEPTPLGQGRGVDHMGIAVRDLGQATRDFEALGFSVRPGGRFPGGISNARCYLSDHFYVELLTVTPNYGKDAADVGDFLKKHEGAMFLGLNTSSAKAAADVLRARGFDALGPEPGSIMTGDQTKPPPPMWYSAYTADKPAKGTRGLTLPIFFIEYVNGRKREETLLKNAGIQRNGARGVGAVWFAVKDLKALLDEMRGAGFAGPRRAVSFAGLKGRALAAGAGEMNLLQADAKTAREDGAIVGVSLEVADLAKARALAEAATHAALAVYDGTYGKSILLPPTHGVLIELFRK